MTRWSILIALLAIELIFFSGRAHGSTDTDYLKIYLGFMDAERLEKEDDNTEALAKFSDCYRQLEKIHRDQPDWEPVLVQSRSEDCRAKMVELKIKTRSTPPASPLPTFNEDELKQRALALETVAATNGAPSVSMPSFQPSPRPFPTANIPAPHTLHYPWKSNIVTTVFWIGEEGMKSSSWDTEWAKHNGGADDHYEMSGYTSSAHASMLNPFYVALPFNDLRHPDEAKKYVPANWTKPAVDGKLVSACRGQWVEMKNRAGRVCFAQWEDVGPEGTNNPGYIFGAERPSASVGLSISPAVAKYLGIDGTSILSWRFVDNEDVLPGMWLRYDEQAVLFRAMHEADAPAAKPNLSDGT